jgi:hypothetical protein
MRWRARQHGRRGNVLVLFALLVFVLFAVAALVIDMGLAFTTRRQMQTAVDSAALEGLRHRDDPVVAEKQRDRARRQAASTLAAAVFDDDLDPEDGDPQGFGAGPVFDLTPGVGAANALETVRPGTPPVYKPQRHDSTPGLELNLANEKHGDMVAGTFGPNPAYPAGTAQDEDQSYDRRDFVPADAASSGSAGAFLVRMRRTSNFQGLDDVANVSSRGPTLPLLFGRGSLVAGGNAGAGYSPRHDGITVRATAIAATQRALSVGNPFSGVNPLLPGVTPFVLDRLALWDNGNFLPSTSLAATVDAAGTITVTTPGFPPGPHGRFASPAPTSVGQPVPASTPVASGQVFPVTGYVPIVQAVANGSGQPAVERVIGFGRVTMTLDAGAPGGGPLRVRLTKLPGIVAPENASAVATTPLSVADGVELANLWNALGSFSDPLLAPALVR